MENFEMLPFCHHNHQSRITMFLRSLHRKPYLVFITYLKIKCDYHSQVQMRDLKQGGFENLPKVIKLINHKAGIQMQADWH